MPLKRTSEFQSTRLSRASTCRLLPYRNLPDISIHKALTSLDRILDDRKKILGNFNPQGSHEPRPMSGRNIPAINNFNPQGSHEPRLSCLASARLHKYFNPQGSHEPRRSWAAFLYPAGNFNPQGSHEPRQQKYTIILASMPNLYILIIHLQQIIQQVKKFSRILILFSGRLQCESPWNFMCNYYSHQSFLTKNQPSFKLPPLSICAKFSRTILNNHLKWRSQLTVYPAVYYVLSRSKNSNVFT